MVDKDHTSTHIIPRFDHLFGPHGAIFMPRQKNPNFIIGVFLNTINIILIIMMMTVMVGFGAVWGIAKAYLETTPVLNTAKIADQAETTYLYDMNGDYLAAYVGSENREWASSDEIPDMLKNAIVSVEDVRFYYHGGIDFKRLIGMAVSNFVNSSIQGGGSTITQQLIKNTLLNFDQTYKRKIQEAYLAIQLEHEYSKDEILVSYMNTIDLGAGNYGVKAAAKDYFDKDLDELTIKECALLAGITKYPYAYNPRRAMYGTGSLERVENRTELVLNRMYEAGYISKQERDTALLEPMEIKEESTVHSMYNMPYFVEYVIDDVITAILQSRGLKTDDTANRNAVELEIRNNGYRIYTTVDPKVQLSVESALANWDKYPSTAKSSDSVVTAKNADGSIIETIQPQAAAVVYDYKTGQLRAIVGGREAPDVKKSINRVTATMPVGSSIKPLSVYAPAVDLGASPATIIPNVPVAIDGWNTATGYPATSASTYGPISIRKGLTNSINIVAARVLMGYVGLETSKQYLMSMGVNAKHINVNPAGLALGTSGITPLEMAVAYGCIANGGEYISPVSFTKVVDTDGSVIVDATESQVHRQAIKPATAYLMVDMLEDVVSEGTGKNARISGMTVGGKTGTNQENRGIYFCGITPYYSASLWIGHDDYKPLKSNAYASSYAAPLWQDFMSDIHDGLENKAIIDADPESLGLVKATVCPVSGMLATENCAQDLSGRKMITDWFTADTVPTEECTWHLPITEICAASNKLATVYCPEDTVIQASPLYLHKDSIYFDIDVSLQKQLFPLLLPQSNGNIYNLIPSDPAYYTYFCDIHTATWNEDSVKRPQAVKAANNLISEVRTFIQESVNTITPDEVTKLYNLVGTLETMVNDSQATSQQITTATEALNTYYQQIIAKYMPPDGSMP